MKTHDKIVWLIILITNCIALGFSIRSCQLNDKVEARLRESTPLYDFRDESEEDSCPDPNAAVDL
jgi:hypothetical protein